MRRSIHVIDGTKVRSIRDEQGLTARALAAKVGVHEAYMGRIEKNERRPSPLIRKRITEALGVELSAIAAETNIAIAA